MSIFEILGRLLEAIGQVFKAWPAGQPIDLSTFLLEVFKVASLEELVVVVNSITHWVLKAPHIIGTVFDSILFFVFFGIGSIVVALYFVWYWRVYTRIVRTDGGLDAILNGDTPIIEPQWYGLRMLVILPFLAAGVGILQVTLNAFWESVLGILRVIFGGDISFGGAVVSVLWRILTEANVVVVILFLFTFVELLVGFVIVFIKRYVAMLLSTVTLFFGLLEFAKGRRDTKILAKIGPFIKDAGKLAVMILFVAISFKILEGVNASGSVSMVAMLVVFVLSWWIPRRLLAGMETFLSSSDVDEYLANPDMKVKQGNKFFDGVKKILVIDGQILLAVGKLIPEVAPFVVAGEATYKAARGVSKPGGVQTAVQTVATQSKRVKTHVGKLRKGKNQGQPEPIPSAPDGERPDEHAPTGVTAPSGGSNARRPMSPMPKTAEVPVSEADVIATLVGTLPQIIIQRMDGLDSNPEVNDALLGLLAGLFFYDPPTQPIDVVVEEARQVCEELQHGNPSKFSGYQSVGVAIKKFVKGA